MKKITISLILVLLFLVSLSFISASSQLKVTEEHPFLVDGEWIDASELEVGDILQTYDGKQVRITNLEDIVKDENFLVYNLEAEPYHDFVVGDEDLGIVVHNSDKLPRRKINLKRIKEKPNWLTNEEWNEYLLKVAGKKLVQPPVAKKSIRVGKQIDVNPEASGSGASVFFEEGAGGKRVVKVYSIDSVSKKDFFKLFEKGKKFYILNQAKHIDDYYIREIKNMKLAEELGLRKFYGEVDVGNREVLSSNARGFDLVSDRAYSMDYVDGDMYWRMKDYITEETLSDALAKYQKLWDAGYVQRDFQFFVTKQGKAEIIDWGSVVPKKSDDTWAYIAGRIYDGLGFDYP